MPRAGAMLITDYPPDTLYTVTCTKCDRKGQYRGSSLRRMFPQEDRLPAITELLSADCPKRKADFAWDRCGAGFDGSHLQSK